MGQKVNPYAFRLGVNKTWKSQWYVHPREFASVLHEDILLRKEVFGDEEASRGDISEIEIVRQPQRVTVFIKAGRPGVIIGSKGASIERLNKKLQKLTSKKLQVKVREIKRPELDSKVIGLSIARQLEGRSPFKRVLKMSVSSAMKAGAKGIKIQISGRLGGAEMARRVELKEGRIPLQTLRADIDYSLSEAKTIYGVIGIKVWVCNGEILGDEKPSDAGAVIKTKKNEG